MGKRRRIFKGYRKGFMILHGVYYDQWNVQLLYRKDIGWTGEQYSSIQYMFDMLGCDSVKIVKKLNILDILLRIVYSIRRKIK